MSEKEKNGSFIIQKQKHLQEFGDPDLRYYSSTLFAGQCGRFLGKIRGLEVIHDLDKIDVFAADLGIYDPTQRDRLLQKLQENGCIEVFEQRGGIEKIEESMNTEREILQVTSEIWEEKPSPEEVCSLNALKYCTQLPRLESEVINHLDTLGLSEKTITLGIGLTTKFRMNTRHSNIPGINQPVLHTPLYSSYNIAGIVNKLARLDHALKQELEATLKQVGDYQATPLNHISFPSHEMSVLNDLGVYDITKVETSLGSIKKFVFTPAMWGPFGSDLLLDEQEHVRAMLSCVRYGQFFPTEIDGKKFPIKMPSAYLGALIRRGRVGPASPIGSDYVILEREGIVKLEKSQYKRNQYEMVLIKEDVARRAKRVLDRTTDDNFRVKTDETKNYMHTGVFRNPIQTRLTDALLKKPTSRSDILIQELIKKFRGE